MHGNNLFPPSPSPSPLSGQEDIVKQFDLPCYMKWARKRWIFLGSSLEFKWFEGCLDKNIKHRKMFSNKFFSRKCFLLMSKQIEPKKKKPYLLLE